MHYQHDAQGSVTSEKLADGAMNRYQYDPMGASKRYGSQKEGSGLCFSLCELNPGLCFALCEPKSVEKKINVGLTLSVRSLFVCA